MTGQGEARRPQRFQALSRFRRRQRGDARIDAGKVTENDARIHQRHSVIGEEGWRFQERIELRELINVPEERNWPMYKGSFGDDQCNRDSAHIRRIKHSDQLHEVSGLARRCIRKETAKTQGATGGWSNAAREESLRSQAMRGN